MAKGNGADYFFFIDLKDGRVDLKGERRRRTVSWFEGARGRGCACDRSVCRLSVLRSALRGDGRPYSEEDLPVEFGSGKAPGLAGIEVELYT